MPTIKLNTDYICLGHLSSNAWSLQENLARLAASQSARTIVAILRLNMYLSYGNIAWRNILTQQLETVQRLQRKITRIITFLKFKEYTDPLFKELSILVYHHLPKTSFVL